MLLELQALVSPTSFGIPKRTATGVDYNRVSMIISCIRKTCRVTNSKSRCIYKCCWRNKDK